jgi:hypothetical protein
MTEQNFIDAMLDIGGGDKEQAHSEADTILLNALRELGWSRLADTYCEQRREIGFWYA